MSIGEPKVFDGNELRSISLALPDLNGALTGAQLIELAESKISESLSGLSLAPHLKTAAISAFDDVAFRRTVLSPDQASEKFKDYISAVADALRDDPLAVSILDGNTLRLFLEDEDDFAMLAEHLFTDLDVEDKGKLRKSEIKNALVHMGAEMGIPPFSEFPVLNDILKKHGAEGEEELGQAQFAHILQPVLQDIADALDQKPVAVIVNVEIINGSRLRKVLADEKQLNSVIEKVLQEKPDAKNSQSAEQIRSFLEKNGKDLGLPPLLKDDEAASLLYETVFSGISNEKCVAETKGGFREFVKEILEQFAQQLEAKPVCCHLDH